MLPADPAGGAVPTCVAAQPEPGRAPGPRIGPNRRGGSGHRPDPRLGRQRGPALGESPAGRPVGIGQDHRRLRVGPVDRCHRGLWGPGLRAMTRTHPDFWGAGWAGIFVGSLLSLYGTVVPGEVAQLAGGYGLLLAGSALYLIAGLGPKQTLAR